MIGETETKKDLHGPLEGEMAKLHTAPTMLELHSMGKFNRSICFLFNFKD